MSDRITINPRTGLLAVARHNLGWMIVGSDIELHAPHLEEPDWQIDAESYETWAWLRARWIADTGYRRRQDALRVLTALHHHDPLPAVSLSDQPRLRHDAGLNAWVSACGHYTITRTDDGQFEIAADSIARRIEPRWAPTLRMARRAIANREALLAQEKNGDV